MVTRKILLAGGFALPDASMFYGLEAFSYDLIGGQRRSGADMGLFRKKSSSTEVSEPFVTLIQVAREDPDIKSRLLGIVSLDAFNRKSALNTLMEDMRLRGAPTELMRSLSVLPRTVRIDL